jgi:hypothetical protein
MHDFFATRTPHNFQEQSNEGEPLRKGILAEISAYR